MVERAVAGEQRLIPVMLGDVGVPLFASTRLWIDFRNVDGPDYFVRVEELARAIKNERPPRPAPGEPLQPGRRGLACARRGAVRGTLRIERDRLGFADGDNEVERKPAGHKACDAQPSRGLDASAASRALGACREVRPPSRWQSRRFLTRRSPGM